MHFLERAHASARMGHFVLDPNRRTIEFSSWVRENIGLNDMPIPVERLPEIIPDEEREAFSQIVERIIEAREDFVFETPVVTARGVVRTQRVTGIPAFENERSREGLIGYFGILQEITHEKETERGLIEARDNARGELAAKTKILVTVSHEIRTPLGGILGIIDQLKHERSPSERDRALGLIEDSCGVLLDTLDAILQQSRIGQDADNLSVRPFRPRVVANRVAELFRPLARRKALSIEVNATSDAKVMGDPARIQQVLANFVSNSVKFTQSGGVTILVQEPGDAQDQWTFVVSDTGSGMDEKRVEGIFEPFGQSSDDTLGKTEGAGLGLSITQQLVEAMGGSIEVQSQPGRGSAFTVRLPLDAVQEEPVSTSPESAPGFVSLAIERASDRVQAEAIATQFGYEIVSLEDATATRIGELTIIADHAAISEIEPSLLEACQRIVVLGERGEIDGEERFAPISYVAQASVSRGLMDLFEGDQP